MPYIGKLFGQSDWSEAGQGWEGKDGELALTGWQASRRVVVLRRPFKGEVADEGDDNGQQLLAFVQSDRKDGICLASGLGQPSCGAVQFQHGLESLVCDHLKRVLAGIGPPPTRRLLENQPVATG